MSNLMGIQECNEVLEGVQINDGVSSTVVSDQGYETGTVNFSQRLDGRFQMLKTVKLYA